MPIVAIYYLFNIVLVSLSIKAAVCVLNINFRGANKNELKVPKWLKNVLFIKNMNLNNSNGKSTEEKNQDQAFFEQTSYNYLRTDAYSPLLDNRRSLGIINGKIKILYCL